MHHLPWILGYHICLDLYVKNNAVRYSMHVESKMGLFLQTDLSAVWIWSILNVVFLLQRRSIYIKGHKKIHENIIWTFWRTALRERRARRNHKGIFYNLELTEKSWAPEKSFLVSSEETCLCGESLKNWTFSNRSIASWYHMIIWLVKRLQSHCDAYLVTHTHTLGIIRKMRLCD